MGEYAHLKNRDEVQLFKKDWVKCDGDYKVVSARYPAHIAMLGWMENEGFTQTTLADRLHVTQGTVSEWLNRKRAPTAAARTDIFRLCSIPSKNWDR